MEPFFAPEMIPFSAALALLAGLVLIETALLTIGLGVSGIGDSDLGDADMGADAPEVGAFGKALSFVGFGKVPAMVVVMSLAGTFGAAGFLVQQAAEAVSGSLLPASLAAVPALFLSLATTGRIARTVARILPSDETSAVSANSLIGRTATLTYGEATTGSVATAKVTDHLGGVHVIHVKAGAPEDVFTAGDRVLIASRSDGFFIGTPVPSPSQQQ